VKFAFAVCVEILLTAVKRDGNRSCSILCVVQAPIPCVVLSYRLSRSLRGWHPGHHELADSVPDASSSQEDQPQRQRQQQQQPPPPSDEYGAVAKFAGMTVRRRYTRITAEIVNGNFE